MQQQLVAAGLAPLIAVDSAGTGGWHAGELADPRTRAAASRRGITLTHRARQVTLEDLGDFDYLIAMDRNNRDSLVRLAAPLPRSGKIVMLRDFEPGEPADRDVPDPYYGNERDFEHVLDICEHACAGLLAHVQAKLPNR